MVMPAVLYCVVLCCNAVHPCEIHASTSLDTLIQVNGTFDWFDCNSFHKVSYHALVSFPDSVACTLMLFGS